ncbi:MAG: hypothetical protein IJL03_01600 [Lachnospiraceae bacterium]|nr:hypothetical protein [Lachnospiraceae bacterium]
MREYYMFWGKVFGLILVSAIILVLGMRIVANDDGYTKQYSTSEYSRGKVLAMNNDDTPTAQSELQKKFQDMYEISDDGKKITVVSKSFLEDYWRSNYEKEEIRSLNQDEVYFVIQDSIRIYNEFEEVELTEYVCDSSNKEIKKRFPLLQKKVIKTGSIESDDGNGDLYVKNVLMIILYRLTALSSPKAFFTSTEACQLSGLNSKDYSEDVFYILGYSQKTDRDYILTVVRGTHSFIDINRFSSLLVFPAYDEGKILLSSQSIDDSSTIEVYPVEEMRRKLK